MARSAVPLLVLVALASAPPAAARGQAAVTPVQKVIQLLTGMVEKGKKEKHAEQVQFAAYQQFCSDTTAAKQNAIKAANEKMEMLEADIQQGEAESAALTKKIAAHDEDISTWEANLKAATHVRELENTDFEATHKDYTQSIQALEEGVATLKKEQGNTKGASAALIQRVVSRIPVMPAESRKAISALVPDENLAVASPEANAYSSQAGAIIDMLVKLQDKFQDERRELEDEETQARHAFEMIKMDLTSQIERATSARTEKSESKAKELQAAADAKGDLLDTTTTRDDDSKYLADLTATCEQKATAFGERQELRADEIVAVEKAIEILSSGSVTGMSEKHLPQLVQLKSSLAQLRSVSQNPNQVRVAAYLKRMGSKINSRILTALALHVSVDPFKKVKKMIKDMLVKLFEEANEEASQKGFCDTELSTNEQTRKEKSAAVETLTAEIDNLEASVAKLLEEITDLTKAVSDLAAAMAQATNIREEEKAKNAETVKDAREAQTAVAQALSVLKEFYEKAGDATAFVQEPEIFDEPYKGMQSENGGVVGMIEVIQSDFARLESETQADETQAQKEYDEFTSDSSIDKAQKTADIDHKTEKKESQSETLQQKRTDLDGEQKELQAAMSYYEKLKPSCVDASESYEDRVARRKEEIESLQQALKILSGEELA